MNKADVLLGKIFYVNNRGIRHTAVNAAIAVLSLIVIFILSSVLGYPALLALGYVFVFYSFMTLGKGGGLAVGAVLVFMNIIALLGPLGSGNPLPYTMVILFLLLFMFFLTRFIDIIDEKENKQRLRSEELNIDTNEYRETTAKLKSLIDANHGIIKNYRALNSVAQKLTSALERQVVVDIIADGVKQMIGKPSVKFALLVYHEESGLFVPAVEDKNPEMIIKGAVKIYKKDPFDEWIIANKYTLFLKNISDDFRFKDLKKELFKFKSMIAIPLIENKKIIGILKFFSEDAGAFDKEDARLLNYLGDLCTTAAQNSILYQKTKDLAIRDGLTGLYLRKFFVERLDEETRRSKETATALSFLLIDIDHFKDCNDTHGHLFGDKVLRILGEFLKDNLRDVDIIGRYGGEEFAVILPNTAMNGSRFVAERLRENFSKLIINVNESEGIKLTLSVGGVEYEKSIKLMELINKADKALYYSKENGRNKVTFWEDIAV